MNTAVGAGGAAENGDQHPAFTLLTLQRRKTRDTVSEGELPSASGGRPSPRAAVAGGLVTAHICSHSPGGWQPPPLHNHHRELTLCPDVGYLGYTSEQSR